MLVKLCMATVLRCCLLYVVQSGCNFQSVDEILERVWAWHILSIIFLYGAINICDVVPNDQWT